MCLHLGRRELTVVVSRHYQALLGYLQPHSDFARALIDRFLTGRTRRQCRCSGLGCCLFWANDLHRAVLQEQLVELGFFRGDVEEVVRDTGPVLERCYYRLEQRRLVWISLLSCASHFELLHQAALQAPPAWPLCRCGVACGSADHSGTTLYFCALGRCDFVSSE
jgi:hypothetical protein